MLTLLASDHWYWFFPLVPLLWLLVFFLFFRFFFWRRRGWGGGWCGGGRAPDAKTILAARYARGEIDHDEYRERLGHLEP
jgi:putative membrane protein